MHHAAPTPFQNFAISQATNSSKAVVTAISADGKYLLTVMDDKGRNSLWLRNVATGSDTQIVPPTNTIPSVAFSPDGNYVYFRRAENAIQSDFNIYRTPVLGGTPQVVSHDVDSGIAFSPDGTRMAYARGNDPEPGKWRLLSAKLDGSDEKVLQILPLVYLPRWLAWSPDGKKIAFPNKQTSEFSELDLFDLGTGKLETHLSPDKQIGALQWSPGGDGLFLIYRPKGPDFTRAQIGFFSLSDGQIRTISRDTNSYSTLTLSADGRTLATVQQKAVTNLFILSGEGSASPTPNPVVIEGALVTHFNWAADGSLVTSDLVRLIRTDAGGKNPSVLVSDANAAILEMSSCGPQYMVFLWGFRAAANYAGIWRVNADGSHPVQLTDQNDFFLGHGPVCSETQNWAYFFRDLKTLWRVPLDGSGKAESIAGTAIANGFQTGRGMGISPDGKELAYLVEFTNLEAQNGVPKLAILNLETLKEPRYIDANPHIATGPIFTPDGKALAYPVRENGVDNIWIHPLDGSPGHQITKFDSEQIRSFHWSPDGKNLGVLRGHTDSDVVLLRESK